jgi:hypothetical protein
MPTKVSTKCWMARRCQSATIAALLGELPAVLAFDGSEQAAYVLAGLLSRFAAAEQVSEAGHELVKVILPGSQVGIGHQFSISSLSGATAKSMQP